jgi:hypothetical protein
MLLSRNLGILPIVAAFVFGPHNAASAAETDSVELSNLAACYADGIDMIGNGKSEAGASRWRQCFAEDLKFTLTFGTSFSMTCPGEKCPMPASMSGVDRRVAAARNTYDRRLHGDKPSSYEHRHRTISAGPGARERTSPSLACS